MSRTQAWASGLALALFAVLTLDLATVSTRVRIEDGPTVITVRKPSPRPSASPSPSPTPNSCPETYNPPDPFRPVMELSFEVGADYATVTGHEQLTFFPTAKVTEVILRLWPNSPISASLGGGMTISNVAVQGISVTPVLEQASTLARLPMRNPGFKGLPVSVTADFTMTLPRGANERFGYEPGLSWFGSGFPLLAYEPGKGWATDPPTHAFAEAATSPAMSVTTTVTVPQAGDQVVGPGKRTPIGPTTTRFTADSIRDVAIAVGRFTTASGVSAAGVPIDAYVADGVSDSTSAYVQDQVSALNDHANRLGPYPYPRLASITLPSIRGGIEYPGVIFYGPNQHGATTSHEVAHQWFYSLVGNDQGRDPWLDESFATFIEALHRGTNYANVPIPAYGLDRVGQPMAYWEPNTSAYFNSVYLQGANALIRARNAVGATNFDNALRCYIRVNAHRIATPNDLARAFRLLPPVVAELRKVGALPTPGAGK